MKVKQNKMQRNRILGQKKGMAWTWENLMILLSVMCIVLLVFFAVMLFSMFYKTSPKEMAKTALKEITAKTASVNIDGAEKTFLAIQPAGWMLVLFDKESTVSQGTETKITRPAACKIGQDCLCICPDKDSCEKEGACQNTDVDLKFKFMFEEYGNPRYLPLWTPRKGWNSFSTLLISRADEGEKR